MRNWEKSINCSLPIFDPISSGRKIRLFCIFQRTVPGPMARTHKGTNIGTMRVQINKNKIFFLNNSNSKI
jgi:hypothetical protein